MAKVQYVTITFVDTDSGNGDDFVAAGNAAVDAWAQSTDNSDAAWIATLAKFLISVIPSIDSDDYLGQVRLRVDRIGSTLTISSLPGDDTEQYFEPADPNRHYYRLKGSGSIYTASFEVV